jgi:hypothetical protein
VILFSFITTSSAKENDKKMKRGMFRTGNIPLFTRAESGTRTRDLLITNELLYQLSYFGSALFVKSDANLRFSFNLQNENEDFFHRKEGFFRFTASTNRLKRPRLTRKNVPTFAVKHRHVSLHFCPHF